MGYSRISSICLGIVNLLLVKFRPALSNGIKKYSLFCFCKFLCLVDLRICVFLYKTKSWFEISIKFNQYNKISFQTAVVGFSNLRIHLLFKEFNKVCMSKTPTPPTKWRAELMPGWPHFFCSSKGNCICFFQFPF